MNGENILWIKVYETDNGERRFTYAYSTHTRILIQSLLGPVILIQLPLGPVTLVFWFLIS